MERSEQAELAQTTAKDRLDASRRYWEVETSLKAVAGELQGKQQLLKDAASVRAAHRRRADLEGAIPLLKAAHDAEVGALAADSAAVAARVALGSLNLEARGEALRQAAEDSTLREGEYTRPEIAPAPSARNARNSGPGQPRLPPMDTELRLSSIGCRQRRFRPMLPRNQRRAQKRRA